MLAERLSLTGLDLEKEPYILTEAEEKSIIRHAISSAKSHAAWKMKGLGYSDGEIMLRLSETDFEKEINREAVLQTANSNKIYDEWQKENRENARLSEIKRRQDLVDTWTAENVFKLMKWTSQNHYGKKLIVNDNNKKLITALCFFISRDNRFETELGFSRSKGLLIRGVSGLGKTHLVKCIESNGINPILILSMIEIADDIKQEGEYNIPNGNHRIIYLDDVGTEEATINHFGTKINYFKNFIETIYLRNIEKGFDRLMISTNNSFNEIEDKYGFRVRSRMKEMFNVIDVKGNDMRK